MQMQAASKATALRYRGELPEAAAKTFRFDFHEVELAEARRIGNKAAISKRQQLNMTCGMLSSS